MPLRFGRKSKKSKSPADAEKGGAGAHNDDDDEGDKKSDRHLNSRWTTVRKNIPRILEYGREVGILPPLPEEDPNGQSAGVFGLLQQAAGGEESAESKSKHLGDKVNLPTNDLSTIHEAIPFLPVPIALFCMLMNFTIPGSGTILCGIFGLCMGQARINVKEGRAFVALIVNFCVGIAQFMTITFFLVGWFWSIAWGGLLMIHSLQYREALLQRRKEAVAVAAIEALTKDSILHRRDVKTLVKDQKKGGKKK